MMAAVNISGSVGTLNLDLSPNPSSGTEIPPMRSHQAAPAMRRA
jgi:hypothetical protein